MHARTWLCGATYITSATLAVMLAGCSSASSKAGTSTDTAAQALTKAVTFDNGMLVDGLLPLTSENDVSLLPLDGDPVGPGGTALMSFDIDNPDGSNNALLALIEFSGADGHFEVDTGESSGDAGTSSGDDAGVDTSDAGRGAAGASGGGKQGKQHVTLMFHVDSKVCDNLCDTTYDIPVKQAVKLKNGKISKHANAKFTLDCTKKGVHSLCGKANAPTGTRTTSGASAGTRLITSFNALEADICKCTTSAAQAAGAAVDAGVAQGSLCGGIGMGSTCTAAALDKHAKDLGTQLSCMQTFVTKQQACVTAAKCDVQKIAMCDIVKNVKPGSGDGAGTSALSVACGELPVSVKPDVDACNPDMGSTMGTGGFTCGDGSMLPPANRCDGNPDCTDGSDEIGCGSSGGPTTFACANGNVLSRDKLCDGHDDCGDGVDEMVCIPCDSSMKQVYNVYAHCDGKMDCPNGEDEMGCTYPCADGKGTIPIAKLCDKVNDCADKSDESVCGTQDFPCGDGSSIPFTKVCDKVSDCPSGIDEASCGTMP